MEKLKSKKLELKACPFLSFCQDYKEIRLEMLKETLCESPKQHYEICLTYYKLLAQCN